MGATNAVQNPQEKSNKEKRHDALCAEITLRIKNLIFSTSRARVAKGFPATLLAKAEAASANASSLKIKNEEMLLAVIQTLKDVDEEVNTTIYELPEKLRHAEIVAHLENRIREAEERNLIPLAVRKFNFFDTGEERSILERAEATIRANLPLPEYAITIIEMMEKALRRDLHAHCVDCNEPIENGTLCFGCLKIQSDLVRFGNEGGKKGDRKGPPAAYLARKARARAKSEAASNHRPSQEINEKGKGRNKKGGKKKR